MPTILYRYYDATNTLLYIGISNNFTRRSLFHRTKSLWWDSTTTIRIERFQTRTEAETAERQAITVEKPLHNTQFTPLQPKPLTTRRAPRSPRTRVITSETYDDFFPPASG